MLLAFRRQRTTELIAEQTRLASDRDHEQRDRVAAQTEIDAIARRITDQYAKAAEQLGSDKAPVRLAGLYSLERIGDANSAERQTVVNILCAYLRMPSDTDENGSRGADETPTPRREKSDEAEVRNAAQNILLKHSCLPVEKISDPGVFWENLEVDLSNARLDNLSFVNMHLRDLNLSFAEIHGPFYMSGRVDSFSTFQETVFHDRARISSSRFSSYATFHAAQFRDSLIIDATIFAGAVTFEQATFLSDLSVNAVYRSMGYRPSMDSEIPQEWESRPLANGRWRLIKHGHLVLGTYRENWEQEIEAIEKSDRYL